MLLLYFLIIVEWKLLIGRWMMTDEFLYVHLDNNSNAILAKGITHSIFYRSLAKIPKNILLLSPTEKEGEFDPHTGLQVIRGETLVKEFLYTNRKDNSTSSEWSWIDYTDLNLLHQISSTELSELLYFGHTMSALHSPFFYKLQNNFAYFDTNNGLSKVYYRDLSVFYTVLGKAITTSANKRIIDRKSFFKKIATISELDSLKTRELQPLLQEGALICFNQKELIDGKYSVPIFIVEEKFQFEDNSFYSNNPDALIVYNHTNSTWDILI